MDMLFTDSQPVSPRDSGQLLRPLGWSEFCARLAAAQATRRVLGQGAVAEDVRGDRLSGGSFYYRAATAMQRPDCDDDRTVNLILSANGKCDGCRDDGQVETPSDFADRALTLRDLP
jgi:hypothetical protein